MRVHLPLVILLLPALAGCLPDLGGYDIARGGGADGSVSGQRCELFFDVEPVRPNSSGCTIDESVSGRRGRLSYDCAGGSATATIGDQVFVGGVVGDQLEVQLTRTYMGTSCLWETTQTISGTLPIRIGYHYSEQPASGESGCQFACYANADLVVTPP